MRVLKPLLLALCLGGVAVLAWRAGVGGLLSWSALARHRMMLADLVAAHPVLAPLAYAVLYAALVALSIPESALVTVAGGLLFGTVLGGALAVAGSATGAVILFLVARSAFASKKAHRAGSTMARVRAGLHRDGFSYLLAARLVPALPFWLVNLAAALCGMRLVPYAAATLLGIIPATFILAWIGSGVGDVLAAGQSPSFHVLFSFQVLGPLILLAALALLPVLLRHLRAPRSHRRGLPASAEPVGDSARWARHPSQEEADDPGPSSGRRPRSRSRGDADQRAGLGAGQH